jgi:hypothetical protein
MVAPVCERRGRIVIPLTRESEARGVRGVNRSDQISEE